MRRFPQRKAADQRKRRKTTEAPTEVIADILSRLPVKTLLRFKSVSKPWYDLISDPWFVDLHRQRSKRNLNVLYVNCKEEPNINGQYRTILTFNCVDSEWNISEVFIEALKSCGRFHYFGIVSSYNGLICFLTSNNVAGREHIYLFNPVSHRVFALPERKRLLDFPHSTFGFGYLSSTREYKVLRLFITDYTFDIKCEILTFCPGSEGRNPSCSWRAIRENFPGPLLPYPDEPVFVHECFHWLSWGSSRRDDQFIISFDLRTEKFSIIPLPSGLNTCPISGDSLSLIVDDFVGNLSLVKHNSPVFVSLWVLEDYDKHIWKRTCDIDFRPMLYPRQLNDCLIRRYMANGELLILCCDSQRRNFCSHYFYNVESHSCRRVPAPRDQAPEFYWSLGFYWESLDTL